MSRDRVTELCVELLSWARMTEPPVKFLASDRTPRWASVTAQCDRTPHRVIWHGPVWQDSASSHLSHRSAKGDLERSSKDQARQCFARRPQTSSGVSARTEQDIGLLTISALAEGDSFGQTKQYLPWTISAPFSGLKLRLTFLWSIQQQHSFWHMETWHHREAESSSLFSDSWPRQGRLPEREQSQLVLDQVLLNLANMPPFYANSDQSHLISNCRTWLTYIRCLDNGYNSDPDWYKLLRGRFRSCLPCHTCLSVSFVSRPSRSHLLLAFFTVLGFRISLINFIAYLTLLPLWILTYCWHSSCFIIFEFLWLKSLYFQPFSSCTSVFQ